MLLLRSKDQEWKNLLSEFRNLPLQAMELTWVICKLSTTWPQSSEPGSCAVGVSYRQITSMQKLNQANAIKLVTQGYLEMFRS